MKNNAPNLIDGLKEGIQWGYDPATSFTDEELKAVFCDVLNPDVTIKEIREHILPKVFGRENRWVPFIQHNKICKCGTWDGMDGRCNCGENYLRWERMTDGTFSPIAFGEAIDHKRLEALDELTAQAQELDMGY